MTESVLITSLMGSIAVLAGVIGKMYLMQRDDHKETKVLLQDCTDDRENLWKAIADMRGETPENVKEEYTNGKKNV